MTKKQYDDFTNPSFDAFKKSDIIILIAVLAWFLLPMICGFLFLIKVI